MFILFSMNGLAYGESMEEWLTTYKQALRTRCTDPILLVIAVITLIIGIVNVQTSVKDAADLGQQVSALQEAIGEFTSVAVLILLLVPVFAFFDSFPLTRTTWKRRLLPYLIFSVVFSAVHIFLMVMIREVLWPPLLGGDYQFFTTGFAEALYEYRKDAVTFGLHLMVWELQRQVLQAKASATATAEPITLKSGATTIMLQPSEFLYAKSAGNYAEVTSSAGTQLARITLSELAGLLQKKGCDAVRIHRSVIVNRSAIMETAPIAGGDVTVKLRSGETLRASRRYKNAIEL